MRLQIMGADGVRSAVRGMLFGAITPKFVGQACIRAIVPRPPEIDSETAFLGVPRRHVGFTPISEDTMYVFCCVPATLQEWPEQADLPGLLKTYLRDFGGPVTDARRHVNDPARINYAKLETVVLDTWHRGTAVVVGDAAHCTTPQLASGAAMCLEDAVVLADELRDAASVAQALESFTRRRAERCRFVVEASSQLGAWQLSDEDTGELQQKLAQQAFAMLACRP